VAKVILDVGLRLRLVDIDSHTMEFEPEGLTASVGPDTLAVVCVHPFGIPQPLERARSLAHAAGACVIEDGAQSLGARAGGTPIGGRGDFGLFSLGPGKPLSTGGGGILCTASDTHAEALAAQWATLRSAGGTASGMALARLGAFSTAFHPTAWWLAARAGAQRVGDNEASWGYALRSLTPAQAAIGLRLLPRLDAFNAGRRSRAAAWRTALAGVDGVRWPAVPTAAAGADTGRDGAIYLRLPMLVRDEATADRLCAALNAAGIGAGRMYRRTLAEIFPAAARAAFPGATRVARMLVTLPTNHYLTADDLARGAAVIRREMACA
jgi:dTDP-4-amino-4,6-dideoxygalactose transaminase